MEEELTRKQYLQILEEKIKKVFKEQSPCCCYPRCKEFAINSHVFQKKRILAPIAQDSKLYTFKYTSLFNDDGIIYKWEGFNNALSFKGFCKHHDNNLFSPIEPQKGIVDWSSQRSQYLLAYRSLCRECYINIAIKRVFTDMLESYYFDYYTKLIYMQEKSNRITTIRNLKPYKEILENGIFNNDYSLYQFETIVLPFSLELCISSPIHICDSRGYNYNQDYQEINIINIFPYEGQTIVILGYSNIHDNKWCKDISSKLKSNDAKLLSEALQDIIFRAEFHCMSKKLYHSISSDIPDFLNEWKLNNHTPKEAVGYVTD